MVKHRHTIEELFCEALDLPQEQRRAYLEISVRDSPEFLSPVLEMLDEYERAGSFLEIPVVNHGGRDVPPATKDEGIYAGMNPAETAGQEACPRFSPGERLAGRFDVVRFLARGGMGEVYEVEDRLLQGEHVALKIVRPEISHDSWGLARFEQEVLLARKVHHPNLCPIYECFRCERPEPGFLFFTMKLLHGETMDVFLRRRASLRAQDLLEICTKLMSGIAAIHAAGIVHRDIKPKNVILERNGRRVRVYLLDFGLARLHLSDATVLGTGLVAGTPGYIAPELLLGSRPTRESDLYALGVVLHQVLCGRTPQDGPGGLSLTPAPELLLCGAPSHLIKAVEGLLSNDPEERIKAFRSARGLQRAVVAPKDLPIPPASKVSRRAFAATAVCALATTAVWQRSWLYEHINPLPRKRFVALFEGPAVDAQFRPTILGMIDTIANELARAEASDPDLLVVTLTVVAGQSLAAALSQARDSLGANLVLAASAQKHGDRLNVLLDLLDSATGKTLRSKTLSTPVLPEVTLAHHAVRAAMELLDIRRYEPDEQRVRSGTDQPAALSAFHIAEALLRQDDDTGLSGAIVKYREAVNLDPQYAMAFAKLAQAYARSFVLSRDVGALHLARANSDHAISLDRRLVDGYLSRAAIFEITGEEQSALHEIGNALSFDPSNPKALLWQAQIYSRLNRWPDAERAFHRLIAERPNLWLIYNELGFALHGEGRSKDAIEAFRTAATAAPGNAMVVTNLGLELLQVEAFTEAVKCLSRGLALQPNYDAALSGMSMALRFQKQAPEALPFALKATEANPKEDTNWLELGECYAALAHRSRDARAAYLRASTEAAEHLHMDPTDGPLWILLALYQVKTGSAAAASASLQRAESFGVDDMDSALCKVRVFELLGQREAALFALKRAFGRGATRRQIERCFDLNALRSDTRYAGLCIASGIS